MAGQWTAAPAEEGGQAAEEDLGLHLLDEDTVANLARCATIVKGLMAEQRQTPDNRKPSDLSDAEIDARLKG